MFAQGKKSGKYQYMQIAENRKEAGNVRQQVIATLGRRIIFRKRAGFKP